jgi:hypothetical protein
MQRGSRLGWGLGVLAAVAACSGTEADGVVSECDEAAACSDLPCERPGCDAAGPSTERMPAGELACSVVSCPPGTDVCCGSVSASATGNSAQAYASQMQLVDKAVARFGEVRAEFTFDAPNQQGWVTIELGAELDLGRLAFVGRQDGVADRFLSVNTNRIEEGGCAFSFEPEPRGAPFGLAPGALFGADIFFNSNDFCYGNGRPGRASELAFAIFSTGAGEASLTISNLTLVAD